MLVPRRRTVFVKHAERVRLAFNVRWRLDDRGRAGTVGASLAAAGPARPADRHPDSARATRVFNQRTAQEGFSGRRPPFRQCWDLQIAKVCIGSTVAWVGVRDRRAGLPQLTAAGTRAPGISWTDGSMGAR